MKNATAINDNGDVVGIGIINEVRVENVSNPFHPQFSQGSHFLGIVCNGAHLRLSRHKTARVELNNQYRRSPAIK